MSNIISELPCIKNKCLLLPICKTKKYEIQCDILFDGYFNLNQERGKYLSLIEILFPNIYHVLHSTYSVLLVKRRYECLK